MSLKPQAISPVPEETARIARSAYPKGNVFMHMRGVLGSIYEDESFADLFPNNGQPAEAPWRLALVTVIQFAEGLSDRQAADAVRGRIDVKYAISLDLTDPGFDASVGSRVPRTFDRRSCCSLPEGSPGKALWYVIEKVSSKEGPLTHLLTGKNAPFISVNAPVSCNFPADSRPLRPSQSVATSRMPSFPVHK